MAFFLAIYFILTSTGQRYHVVLNADPIERSKDDNYWIQTVPARGCGNDSFPSDHQPRNETGIIRYSDDDKDPTTTLNPKISVQCSDEPYESLKPIHWWTVGDPSNPDGK